MSKKIAVLAGDGIGPEVMYQALRVIDSVGTKYKHRFEFNEGKIGGQAYDEHENHCPDETLQLCRDADCILFGSVGGPVDQQHHPKWQNCETNSILKLRKQFDLNINIRPVTIYPTLANNCPLKTEILQGGIDCVIFRELTGGIYFGEHKRFIQNNQRSATDECKYDEQQIETVTHAAFKAAKLRRKKVCSVDKANVLATSKLWREVVNEVAQNYPDVELVHMLVDNCAMQLVLNPQQFDVIVTENMFGDIISDLAAALPGSVGLVPSASLNKDGLGLYEPSGGSAPEIAGKDIANPCAQILSAAMMLRYSFGMEKEAAVIEEAVKATISNGVLTKDLVQDESQSVTTTKFTDQVILHISNT